MSAVAEEYNDLVKRMEDGFMEIDNDIIIDLQKQDESYLALCRHIWDIEREYLFILNVTEGGGKYIFDSGRTQGIGGVFQTQFEER